MNSSSDSNCAVSTPGISAASAELFFLFLNAFMKGSKLEEFSPRAGQHFHAPREDQNIVFDANAANAFQVDARLQSYDISCFDSLLLSFAKPWGFMHFNAKPVSRTVHEIAAEFG